MLRQLFELNQRYIRQAAYTMKSMLKNILQFACLGSILLLFTGFTRSWYQRASHGGDARHRVVGFAIGNKGYIGGGHVNSATAITYQDFWEYDPATNTWTQIADYGGGLRYHSSAFVIDGVAYVGAGENATHEYTNDFWKYIPEVNTWLPIADMPGTPRRGSFGFAINGKGYFGTGQSDEGYHTDCYMYDPETDNWTSIADFPGEARTASAHFVYEGKAYVGTGHIFGSAVRDFYAYDPISDSWETLASMSDTVRENASGFCIDNKGYIGFGDDNHGNTFDDLWEYDFATDTWTRIADFPGQKRRYGVTFKIDNNIYLASGTDGTNLKDLWVYAPTLSIGEGPDNDIQFVAYPNPSTDWIKISCKTKNSNLLDDALIQLTDIDGKIRYRHTLESGDITLTKAELGSGLFLIQIYHQSQVIHQTKIIFQ
jgi:N-acetylneuraminic acid mutarotase